MKNRLVSLSDLALSVVDYSDHANPVVVSELTLARNVVNARPLGDSVAELSSDWWGNDVDHSTLRLVPVANLSANVADVATDELEINGQNAQTFHNGSLAYVVSNVCATKSAATASTKGTSCTAWTQEVQVVDYGTKGKISKRGVLRLPAVANGYYPYYYGFYGCFWYDWYNGGGRAAGRSRRARVPALDPELRRFGQVRRLAASAVHDGPRGSRRAAAGLDRDCE